MAELRWRLGVEHVTTFNYQGSIRSSYNEARLTPASTPLQTRLESLVSVSPLVAGESRTSRSGTGNAATSQYTDYWGTVVTVFDIHEPHEAVRVTGRSVVETEIRPTPTSTATWSDLQLPSVRDRFVEFLAPTDRTSVDDELAAIARDLTVVDPQDTAVAVADWVRATVDYVPGVTGVQTSAMESYHQRSGVCQDLAHLTIGLLRSIGVPARYVSGYHQWDVDAQVGDPTPGQSHAWVEWWVGEWVSHDPTNGSPADQRHILVARGRDYIDVTPLKGIFIGAPSTSLDVSVAITRLA